MLQKQVPESPLPPSPGPHTPVFPTNAPVCPPGTKFWLPARSPADARGQIEKTRVLRLSSFILRLCALPTWPTSRTFCLHYRSHTHISFSLKLPHLGLPVSSRSRLCYLLILPVSHSSSVRPLDRPSPGAREHIHNACEMIGCGRDVTPPSTFVRGKRERRPLETRF